MKLILFVARLKTLLFARLVNKKTNRDRQRQRGESAFWVRVENLAKYLAKEESIKEL